MNLRRRIELAWYRARGGFPGNLGGLEYRFVPEDRKYWRKVSRNDWEPHTFEVLDRFLDPDSIYVDVGAWIGPTVLYAAARCRHVYCLEPDPVAYEQLLAHLRMNGIENVSTFHGALGTAMERLEIANDRELGNSETRVISPSGNSGSDVLSLPIMDLVKWWGVPKIDLLKIDVEGGEFNLIPSLAELLSSFKPAIYLSLHAPFLPTEERAQKLETVVEFASNYTHCLDREMQPLKPDQLLGKVFTEKFREIVLCDDIPD